MRGNSQVFEHSAVKLSWLPWTLWYYTHRVFGKTYCMNECLKSCTSIDKAFKGRKIVFFVWQEHFREAWGGVFALNGLLIYVKGSIMLVRLFSKSLFSKWADLQNRANPLTSNYLSLTLGPSFTNNNFLQYEFKNRNFILRKLKN